MKKITIIFISVLMIFASCSTSTSYDDREIEEKTNTEKEDDSENNTEEPSNEEPKEDNSKNNTEEPSNEEDNSENDNDEEGNSEIVKEEPSNEEPKEDNIENEVVEDKTWCEIDEDTKILGLNYFVCVDNSQKKLSPSINDESQAKKDTFLIRGYASKYVEIRVKYDNGKLNFSSVNDTYTIVDVTMEDSNVNITIEWK